MDLRAVLTDLQSLHCRARLVPETVRTGAVRRIVRQLRVEQQPADRLVGPAIEHVRLGGHLMADRIPQREVVGVHRRAARQRNPDRHRLQPPDQRRSRAAAPGGCRCRLSARRCQLLASVSGSSTSPVTA